MLSEQESIRRITFFRLDAIAYGYLIYLYIKDISKVSAKLKKIFLILALCFFYVSFQTFENGNDILYIYSSLITAALILISFRYTKFIGFKHVIIVKTSAFLANTSYCVYLIHLFVFLLLQGIVNNIILGCFIYLFLIMVLSVLSYFIIERPIMSLRPEYDKIRRNKNFFKDSLLNFSSNLIVFFVYYF